MFRLTVYTAGMPKECSSLGCGRPHQAKGLCARCYAKTRQRAAREDPDTRRLLDEDRSRRATGWTNAMVEAALSAQHGRCAICPRELGQGRLLQRDHYETANGVRVSPLRGAKGSTKQQKHTRGLLCGACNNGLAAYEAQQRPAGLRIACYERYRERYGG